MFGFVMMLLPACARSFSCLPFDYMANEYYISFYLMIAAIAVLVVSFLAGLLCTLMLSFLLFSDRLGGIMNEDPKDFVSNRTHTKH